MTIKDFEGKTIKEVILSKNNDEVLFYFTDNTVAKMYHEQDCCETVYLDDGFDDLKQLIGTEILQAYVTTNEIDPDDYNEHITWTFYTISTFYNSATLRWYGSSNGYYSEKVDIAWMN